MSPPRVSFLGEGRGGQLQQNSTLTQPKQSGILVPGLSFPFPNTGTLPPVSGWLPLFLFLFFLSAGSWEEHQQAFLLGTTALFRIYNCTPSVPLLVSLWPSSSFPPSLSACRIRLLPYCTRMIQYNLLTRSLLTQPRSSGNGRRGVGKGGGQGFLFSLSSSFPTAT